jgi:hypothetical protein
LLQAQTKVCLEQRGWQSKRRPSHSVIIYAGVAHKERRSGVSLGRQECGAGETANATRAPALMWVSSSEEWVRAKGSEWAGQYRMMMALKAKNKGSKWRAGVRSILSLAREVLGPTSLCSRWHNGEEKGPFAAEAAAACLTKRAAEQVGCTKCAARLLLAGSFSLFLAVSLSLYLVACWTGLQIPARDQPHGITPDSFVHTLCDGIPPQTERIPAHLHHWH